MYKFSLLETAHRRYVAVKAGCVVWVGLTLRDVLNGSPTALQENSLCVYVFASECNNLWILTIHRGEQH